MSNLTIKDQTAVQELDQQKLRDTKGGMLPPGYLSYLNRFESAPAPIPGSDAGSAPAPLVKSDADKKFFGGPF